jgi:5-hydroxyisourate hydrolase-like protein (transthyretin family)
MLHFSLAPRQLSLGMALTLSAAVACNDSTPASPEPPVATAIIVNATSVGAIGIVGYPLAAPVSVHVIDQHGNAMPGVTVAWSTAVGSGSVDVTTSQTNSTGDATAQWTLGVHAGQQALTASIASGPRATATIGAIANPGPGAAITKLSGDGQVLALSTSSQPFVALIVDQNGNLVANATVAWDVSGGAVLSATSTKTDANGQTNVTLTSGAAPGDYTITATLGSTAMVSYSLRSR